MALKPGALDGIRIVSMAEQYPGPFCTMTLSDMGADVIQVERPGGDPSRFLPSFYEALNRNKRSVALDARESDQKAELLKLIAKADVFIEGFRPGKLAKLGLGYADLKDINPRLIYASVSGYGQTGPYIMRPAHDLTFQGLGGAVGERISGDVEGLPPAALLGDTMSALYTTIGILSALVARNRTGQGTYIDLAMNDAVLALQTSMIAADAAEDAALPQRDPGYDLYQTADGRWLTTSVAHEDAYWDQLCRDVGVEDGIGLTRPDRVARRAELVGKIAERIRRKPFAHWQTLFEASGQMWGPALKRGELADDPQLQTRKIFAEVVRQDGTQQRVIRQPIKFSAFDNAPLRPATRVGEHNGETFD
ncbi:Formyl-coenzyme A transferase [Thalassovita gelatinovora]|uniref:Formyl-coenzyme A transferase n=1 Tax=Thalassovita gelatinovora TaxID=53501 RepID=A0A0P1G3Z6_THAGE|nr:CaiB/BaiF CoA-transferase family protein [Thalassovita gelatinovora]QIZ79628.1 CoA transferase [Thalassovita gelatinovora]CUH66572.1 Formyl-coenzyme A transferase [Thalassovita gelatinovora]SEQ38107.1 Crotonobetainyl-CoA:carnitine CoA-transferase CaiB [Thalassovita gelatinovora]